MNRKQLIFVLIGLAVVGSAGWVIFKQRQDSWNQTGARMGDRVLPDFRPNDVAAIHIKSSTDLNLVHKDGLWRVAERHDYPANFGRISDVLIKLQNLKVVEANTVGPAQLARVNLDEPRSGNTGGTLVEFKDRQGKLLEAILLGKKHTPELSDPARAVVAGEPDGRYILLPKDPRNVFLISDALAGLEPRPDWWITKDFIKVENPKSVSLASSNAADSWKISRETESSPWTLADAKPGEVLDGKKIYQITNALSAPRFADVAPTGDASANGLGKPAVLSVETFDHFIYTIKISPKGPDDNYRVTINVAGDVPSGNKTARLQDKLKQEQALASWVYLINSWIFDPLTRSRAQLLEGYKDDKALDAASAATSAPKPKPAWTPRVIQ